MDFKNNNIQLQISTQTETGVNAITHPERHLTRHDFWKSPKGIPKQCS